MKKLHIILFSFSLTLIAQTQVVVEEIMFMDAPYVGEVTTTTTKYASKGKFRQESAVEVDRFLVRMAMGGNKIIGSIMDGESASRIVYNAKDEEFAMETFDTIRENDGKPKLRTMSSFNMRRGSNDEPNSNDSNDQEDNGESDDQNNDNEYSRTISESVKKISGFDTQKVVTSIKSEEGMVLIQEWFTVDTVLFKYVSDIESELVKSYGGTGRGIPRSFSESMLKQAEQEFKSVPGRMVKYTMEMKDDDDGFKMRWQLKSIKEISFKSSDFEVYKKFEKVEELD
ncbi:MAG: hypothetical protein CMG74_12480 [Candidatus Marinimicrobia bacterium]|nr:hypothetical protein [Candidatus Neomarinimicrobiota bacterium]